MLVWTPASKIQEVEERLSSSARSPVAVAFGTQFGCCHDADWVVLSVFDLVFSVDLLLVVVFMYIPGTGYRGDGGMDTTVVRNSAQVIDHAITFLL